MSRRVFKPVLLFNIIAKSKNHNQAMPFNFNRKNVFLTYAQCDKDPQEVLDYINSLSPVSDYIVAQELHQDGNKHIHAYIKFSSQVHTRNERYFDLPSGHHPNIATPKGTAGIERVKKYCRKGGNFISNFLEEQKSKRQILFEAILEEGLSKKFIMENPMVLGLNYNSICAWVRLVRGAFNAMVPLQDLPKKRHIWLTGAPNSGKSWWLRRAISLAEYPAQIPTNDDWRDSDQDTDLLYYDEYKGQLKIQILNSICDGRTGLNTKGGSTTIGYPLVIICSNYTIEGAYPHTEDFIIRAIRARFNEYDAGVGFPKFSSYFTRKI